MDIARIPGATRTIGESQGYLGLPLRDEPVHCTVNGPATPSMVTAWLPTPDEIAALMAGAAVHVRILGTAHPPIMLSVGPAGEGGGDNPAPAQEPVAVPQPVVVDVEALLDLPCEVQHVLAERLAANVGYVLAEEPEHPDSPHRAAPAEPVVGMRELEDVRQTCLAYVDAAAQRAAFSPEQREFAMRLVAEISGNIEGLSLPVGYRPGTQTNPSPALPVEAYTRLLLEKAVAALGYFADAVFNDNGDMTVTGMPFDPEKHILAYQVRRRILAALPTPPAGEG